MKLIINPSSLAADIGATYFVAALPALATAGTIASGQPRVANLLVGHEDWSAVATVIMLVGPLIWLALTGYVLAVHRKRALWALAGLPFAMSSWIGMVSLVLWAGQNGHTL
jgi:hypothetical protein